MRSTGNLLRVGAFARLRELPLLITVPLLAQRLGGASQDPASRQRASVYLSRWAREGMVKSLGARTGVYFNCVRNPQAPTECWQEAVKMLLPSAVVLGASSLHDSGVTTQIPWSLTVGAAPRRSYPNIEQLDVSPRPLTWYAQMRAFMTFPEQGLARLTSAAALADGWWARAAANPEISKTWSPDPDDLDLDWIEWDQVAIACQALGVQAPSWAQRFLLQPRATPRG